MALCHGLFPLIQKTKGSILNLSGGGATAPRANFSAYSTAKAGLVRFSETLAEEVKSLGVRVNCIAPGAMKTNLLSEVIKKGPQISGKNEYDFAKKIFTNDNTNINRVVDLVDFLITKKGSKITGKIISAIWDDWGIWPEHIDELLNSDAYTIRRITGRDRGFDWGDV